MVVGETIENGIRVQYQRGKLKNKKELHILYLDKSAYMTAESHILTLKTLAISKQNSENTSVSEIRSQKG
jgi:hypothetical protein